MVETSKILTVSYGTFSCTLEGFDDPVTTMRGIAEYFRDLSAGDRYFGAEPPVPDARRLQKVAEQTSNKKVVTRTEAGGVVLSRTDTPADLPSSGGVTEAGSEALSKLQRLREAVARTGSMETAFGAEGEKPAYMDADEAVASAVDDWEEPAPAREGDEALFDAEDEAIDLEDEVVAEPEVAEAEVVDADMVAAEVVAEPVEAEIVAEFRAEAEETAEPAVDQPVDEPAPILLTGSPEFDDEPALEAEPEAPQAPAAEVRAEVVAEPLTTDEPRGSLLSRLGRRMGGGHSASADARAAFEGVKSFADPEARAAALAEGAREGFLQPEPLVIAEDLDAADELVATADPEAALADELWPDEDAALGEPDEELPATLVARAAQTTEAAPEAMNRILAETNSQLEATDSTRRRETIAQLKAAVAATRAEQDEEEDTGELDRFREDFERAVRPPVSAEPVTHPVVRRLAPLMLVSEQRIDPDSGGMPRRVAGNLALAEDELDDSELAEFSDEAFSDTTPFLEYAAAHDASDLQDLIEAAGAYCVYVLGQPYFTRSQLMTLAEAGAEEGTYNREAGLRAFGTLMRLGKVQKVRRGLFSMAMNSRFQAGSVL